LEIFVACGNRKRYFHGYYGLSRRILVMIETIIFFIFAGMAIGSAISVVWHKNPLYSAISLVGVFISLACIYLTLASPFIAITQILVYAGAIMVLVIFVIMLLNVENEEEKPTRLNYLYALGGILGLGLFAQAVFIMYAVTNTGAKLPSEEATMGLTKSIGTVMYTQYLLPVEIVGFMLLMAVIGSVVMARKAEVKRLELVKTTED
jgi:NADH-quinone oxidoreductase subunit J